MKTVGDRGAGGVEWTVKTEIIWTYARNDSCLGCAN